MNKDEIKPSKQLNIKASQVTIPSQIKTTRDERRLQVQLLLLPLLLATPLSIQMFNSNFNQ